jgi:apolipoprotein N-acyltransferase
MLIGATRDLTPRGRDEIYNSSYLLNAQGEYVDYYDKMRLVPFGEALPYFNAIPGLQSVVGIGEFDEGCHATLFPVRGRKFGALICFESTFSQMARMFANAGADFLVVITNDAWYGRSAGAAHHHHLSLLRAVETRRWIARCANTGISSVIAPDGRALLSLPLERRDLLEGVLLLPATPPVTFFMHHGNRWLALPALLALAFFALARARARKAIAP